MKIIILIWFWGPCPDLKGFCISAPNVPFLVFPTFLLAVHWGCDFRITNCHEIVLELVCGPDFCCNRHCKDEPRRSGGVLGAKFGRKSAENRKHQNTELPMNRQVSDFSHTCLAGPSGKVGSCGIGDAGVCGGWQCRSSFRSAPSTLSHHKKASGR